MRAILTPRFWLIFWGGLGAAFLLYVIIVSGVHSGGSGAPASRSGLAMHDSSLLKGEMANFTYALPPRNAPDIPFQFEGEALSLEDFRGKTLLVNFWATWCAPCLKELPSLDSLQKNLGGDHFEVLAIAADPRGPEVAAEYLDRLNITNLKLYGDHDLALVSAMGSGPVLPLTVLYDAKGREIGRMVGEADWQSREAQRLIKNAIGG